MLGALKNGKKENVGGSKHTSTLFSNQLCEKCLQYFVTVFFVFFHFRAVFLLPVAKLEPNSVIHEAYFLNQIQLFAKHISHSSKK